MNTKCNEFDIWVWRKQILKFRALLSRLLGRRHGDVRVDEEVVLENLKFVFFKLRCQIRYI